MTEATDTHGGGDSHVVWSGNDACVTLCPGLILLKNDAPSRIVLFIGRALRAEICRKDFKTEQKRREATFFCGFYALCIKKRTP